MAPAADSATSTTLTEPLPWINSTLLAGDAADAVAKLKEQPGEDIGILGSGELVRSLMPHRRVHPPDPPAGPGIGPPPVRRRQFIRQTAAHRLRHDNHRRSDCDLPTGRTDAAKEP